MNPQITWTCWFNDHILHNSVDVITMSVWIMSASWATTKQCLNCIERRHFITLASDCLLILLRSHHLHWMAVKENGLHVSFSAWDPVFFNVSFNAFFLRYFWRDNNFLFPCFLFSQTIAVINTNIDFCCYDDRNSIKIAWWFMEIESGTL